MCLCVRDGMGVGRGRAGGQWPEGQEVEKMNYPSQNEVSFFRALNTRFLSDALC